MNDLFNKLYSEALKAYNNAYTPYSHFNVGAAILLDDGNIVAGANVENASYGLTNCAERTTLFYLYSLGYKKENIKAMLIIANSTRPISPCGACRQVMMELMPKDCKVSTRQALRQCPRRQLKAICTAWHPWDCRCAGR